MSKAKAKWYLEKFGDPFSAGMDFHDLGKDRLTQEQEAFIKAQVSAMVPRENQDSSLYFAAQLLMGQNREATLEKARAGKPGLLSAQHGPGFFGGKSISSSSPQEHELDQGVPEPGVDPKSNKI